MKIEDVISPEQDPSGKLAAFAADLKFADIPAEHVDFIKKDILDEIGCIIAGSTGPSISEIREVAKELGQDGKTKVLIYGDEMSVSSAGLVNGSMARARDMGDTHNTGGHICEWIIPILLTGIEMDDVKRSGRDFITAFVAGAEWGAREHVNIHLQFHTTEVPGECAGSRYATVALAKFMGLEHIPDGIWNAATLAYSIDPMHEQQKYNEGSPMVRIQHGFVTSHACHAVSMVRHGITNFKAMYMGNAGLFKSIKHGDIISPDFMWEGLGERWVWREGVTMKPYGGCKYHHTPIYALLSMMKEHDFSWRDIEEVHYTVSAGCRCTIEPAGIKWNPTTAAEALFSNPYAVAFAAITGDCFIDAFEEETVRAKMASPEFRELMPRLKYTVDSEKVTTPFDNYPTEVTLKDGRKFAKVEDMLLGNTKNPMTWEDVEHKFWNCTRYAAVDLGEEKYRKIVELCKNLEQVEDVRELLLALVP